MITYVVKDSDGDTHYVEADYVGRSTEGGGVNFFKRDAPNAGIVATFTDPISVIEAGSYRPLILTHQRKVEVNFQVTGSQGDVRRLLIEWAQDHGYKFDYLIVHQNS